MDDENERRGTSEIRMIATEVVGQQSAVCAVKMETCVERIKALDTKLDRMTDELVELATAVAVLRTRWQLFGVIGIIIGAAGTIIGLLLAI